jgi:anti-sigma regulatory factor (Ser/Thr protein kinase)
MSSAAPQLPVSARTFAQHLSSTRRGARLARRLAADWLRAWQIPPDVAERVELVVAELAANAAFHGQVGGRDFRLALSLDAALGVIRVEVTDGRGDHLPRPVGARVVADAAVESGRGLFLVAALADGGWGTAPHPPDGKTVWAEVAVSPASAGLAQKRCT